MKREIIFVRNHAENETGRLVSDRFLFIKKILIFCNVKASHLFYYILIALKLASNKNKLYKTSEY